MATISPTNQYRRCRFGGRNRDPRCGNSAVSKTLAIKSGFTTPIAEVMTIKPATTDTFLR